MTGTKTRNAQNSILLSYTNLRNRTTIKRTKAFGIGFSSQQIFKCRYKTNTIPTRKNPEHQPGNKTVLGLFVIAIPN